MFRLRRGGRSTEQRRCARRAKHERRGNGARASRRGTAAAELAAQPAARLKKSLMRAEAGTLARVEMGANALPSALASDEAREALRAFSNVGRRNGRF